MESVQREKYHFWFGVMTLEKPSLLGRLLDRVAVLRVAPLVLGREKQWLKRRQGEWFPRQFLLGLEQSFQMKS